jgi:hypothetical protein
MDLSDPGRLAPEVLLYDKLVIPVHATIEDKNRWEKEGWRPNEQEEYIKMLGRLAVQKRWGQRDQALWAEEFAKVKDDIRGIEDQSRKKLGYQLTQRILAQQEYPLPSGVEGIDVVAACQSEKDLRTKFVLEKASDSRDDFGLKLGQKIAVPFLDDKPKTALERAVALAVNPEFCQKRTTVYDLQNRVLSDSQATLETVQELEQRTEELIAYVTRMTTKVRFTYAFALVGVQPGLAAGRPLSTFASRSTTLSPVRFRSLDPAFIRPLGSVAPTAVYHE